jgi:hypothetical protein
LVSALPAGAQIGTPGSGPLTPGGPRQGLGPPSITDSVPDLRLHSSGGGIPGAGPAVDLGARQQMRQPRYGIPERKALRAARRCDPPRRGCPPGRARHRH